MPGLQSELADFYFLVSVSIASLFKGLLAVYALVGPLIEMYPHVVPYIA